MSKDFFQVIDAINDYYKKMLEIGKCNKVFRPEHGGFPDILTAKSWIGFLWQRKTYSCNTIDMLKLVHQDSLYLLMLKSYRIQENMQTPTSQCLLKGKFL
jgi:hypothetical protein